MGQLLMKCLLGFNNNQLLYSYDHFASPVLLLYVDQFISSSQKNGTVISPLYKAVDQQEKSTGLILLTQLYVTDTDSHLL